VFVLSCGKQFGVNVLAAEGMWPKSPLARLCAQPAQQAISSFCALCSPTRASDVSTRCGEDEVLVRQHSTTLSASPPRDVFYLSFMSARQGEQLVRAGD
jgi:hypothetical protein